MNIGMLWFDNDPKADLKTKVERAVTYYREKYGKAPTLCFVNPSMIEASPVRVPDIEIRTSRSVLPNHLWVGMNQ